MASPHFPYKWNLVDFPEPSKLKVFGTFVCEGGSTMGYKLAGFNHLGGVEIDQTLATIYKENLSPKYFYNEDIRDFNLKKDLPSELFDLDILDGSPPCSTFTQTGLRERAWRQKKRFREGQKLQTLDDLVFVYIDTIKKLQPKVAILENVPGIVSGNAKWYAKKIVKNLQEGGYEVQVFVLCSSTMGLPQKRKRVFFIARKSNLNWQNLKLEFSNPPIFFEEIMDKENQHNDLTELEFSLWEKRKASDKTLADTNLRVRGVNGSFQIRYLHPSKIVPTLTTAKHILFDIPRHISENEIKLASSFPQDYNFGDRSAAWVCGMSVPPVMIAQIAQQIRQQWFKM